MSPQVPGPITVTNASPNMGRRERRRLQYEQRTVSQIPGRNVVSIPQVTNTFQQGVPQGLQNNAQVTVPTVQQLTNVPLQQSDRMGTREPQRLRGQSQIVNFYQPRLGPDGQPLNQVRNITMGTGIVAAVTPGVKAEQNLHGEDGFAAFCHGCGLVHIGFRHGDPAHLIHDGCKFYQQRHPDYNFEPCDWAVSTIGKAYDNASRANLHWKYAINKRNGVMEPRRDNKRKYQQSSSSAGDEPSPYPLECPTLPCVLKCRDGSSLAEKVHMDTDAFG